MVFFLHSLVIAKLSANSGYAYFPPHHLYRKAFQLSVLSQSVLNPVKENMVLWSELDFLRFSPSGATSLVTLGRHHFVHSFHSCSSFDNASLHPANFFSPNFDLRRP